MQYPQSHTQIQSLRKSVRFACKLIFSYLLCISIFREAEVFKEQGNAYYVKKDYTEAFNYYTKAIGKFLTGLTLVLLVVHGV